MDIVSRIQNQLSHLRPAEQKVARYILKDINFAASASINELAASAKVSHASITRLAQALDCKNVRELKMLLAQSAAVGERFIADEPVSRQEIPPVYQAIQDILDINAGLISDQDIQSAGQLLTRAGHVLVFGVGGGSTFMAQECQNRLFRLEVKSNAYSDPMLMRMSAATVNKDDAVLCLSLSGVSPDVMASALIAKEYGAHLLAICPEGPLADVADLHLPIKTQEAEYIFNPSASRYAMLAAIDVIAGEVAVVNQRKSREKLRRLKHHLDEHRKGSERLPLGD
ncbi:MurR/RpiR family transcriptional regulator [Lacimicrobium alkaliphilum]|uniref:Transcriptional regulator n=1 Tax=Lacimicrobium alkaliphilum TaxID=1526571 RepID=A0ABQ1R6G5_9ALTE|nr:MurR/RpiR family transcriptional regulator [Lacimicrobium alkaliphilum]GGD59934.1 transcriptional regulator [Lacimicrobium alkaliphilum]